MLENCSNLLMVMVPYLWGETSKCWSHWCVYLLCFKRNVSWKKAQPSGILPERGPRPAWPCFMGRRQEKRQEKPDLVTYSCVLKTVSVGSVWLLVWGCLRCVVQCLEAGFRCRVWLTEPCTGLSIWKLCRCRWSDASGWALSVGASAVEVTAVFPANAMNRVQNCLGLEYADGRHVQAALLRDVQLGKSGAAPRTALRIQMVVWDPSSYFLELQ